MKRIVPVVALALTAGLAAPAARAAVNECIAELAGKSVEARTELEARRLALLDWTEQARKLDPSYTRWQIAFNRRIECTGGPASGFKCQAIARPCMVKQVPAPDAVPLRRGIEFAPR